MQRQSFEFRQTLGTDIVRPENIAAKNQRRSHVNQVIRPHTMTCGVAHCQVLASPGQFADRHFGDTHELGLCEIFPKVCVRRGRLLRRDGGVSSLPCQEDGQLQRIDNFYPDS
jgi:hypothetical protein